MKAKTWNWDKVIKCVIDSQCSSDHVVVFHQFADKFCEMSEKQQHDWLEHLGAEMGDYGYYIYNEFVTVECEVFSDVGKIWAIPSEVYATLWKREDGQYEMISHS